MKEDKYVEYFVGFTFKIIPKIFNLYKLMTIFTLDYDNKIAIFIGFVYFKYRNSISILNIFKYLDINYKFNPHIIHSDYNNGISLAIKNSFFFKHKVTHVKCWIHLIKSLREKLNKLHLCNKNNNIENQTFLNNIKIIFFIKATNILKYKKFI